MAHNNAKTWLAFEDEAIADKHKGQINFTTNKFGGKPDYPSNTNIDPPLCPLCQLPRPLVVQIYAPLENSTYHRTLYLFACINPNCWNQSESWTCLRSQTLEHVEEPSEIKSSATNICATDWCADADEWDDNNANVNEKNGNVIGGTERISDEEDESCSFEESVRMSLGSLAVDDRNANCGIQDGGAVGKLHSPLATAEIEGDEGEVISIDTPTRPQRDITTLLQEVAPLPRDIWQKGQKVSHIQFVPYFLSVWEETLNISNINDGHVRDLLQEYQQNNEHMNVYSSDSVGACGPGVDEKYEKSNPAHGDKMFHHFLSRIQLNPGQLVRYTRDGGQPLLLNPLQEPPRKCQYCHGEMIFEFQVLPTLIPKLRLSADDREGSRLEFGTVIVFTCRRSCWSTNASVLQEAVVVQTEMF